MDLAVEVESNGSMVERNEEQWLYAHRAKLYLISLDSQFRSSENERAKPMATTQGNDLKVHDGSAWWALYTRHQHEKVVAEMLSAKGFEVFLPLYESVRRWKDRKQVAFAAALPLLCICPWRAQSQLADGDDSGGPHDSLPRRTRCDHSGRRDSAIRMAVEGMSRVEPHPFLKCGERVRVTRGTLEGVEGVLVRKKNHFAWCFQWRCWRSPWR